MLAVLAAGANTVVSSDRLIELLWDGNPPRRARNLLSGYAVGIRKVLTTIEMDSGAVGLTAREGGYLLELPPECVDLHRFRGNAARARGGAASDRAEHLRAALTEWQGPALSGMRGFGIETMRVGLANERRTVVLDLADVSAELGRYDAAIRDLEELAVDLPYDEAVALRMMTAYSAVGDQAAAVRLYTAMAHRLVRDLRTTPGPALREAGELLLRQTDLGPEPDAVVVAPPARTRVRLPLPPAPDPFAGRATELDRLDVLGAPPPAGDSPSNVFVISGIAGSGKTALAIEWARRRQDRFPDGRLFVTMRGHHPTLDPLDPSEIVARLLLALGVVAADLPPLPGNRIAMYRTMLVNRRVLIVLDDIADTDQVHDLLPPEDGGSAMLITSRGRLPELLARYRVGSVTVSSLDEAAALELLSIFVGAERVRREPEAAARFVRWLGGLPLTVRVGAGYARSRPDDPLALLATDMVDTAPGDPMISLALEMSYRRLTSEERRIFRWLGLMPATQFADWAVAALADYPAAGTARCLVGLVRANLLYESGSGRYQLHDMVKWYASTVVIAHESHAERAAAMTRLLWCYRRAVERASHADLIAREEIHRGAGPADGAEPGLPGASRAGLTWLDEERSNICAAIKAGSAAGSERGAWQLADAMSGYIRLHPGGADWTAAIRAATSAAERSGNRRAHAAMLLGTADAEYREGNRAAELESAGRARDVSVAVGWRGGEGLALAALGRSWWSVGEIGLASRYLRWSLDVHRELGDPAGQANAIGRLARIEHDRGRLDEALRGYVVAAELTEAGKSKFGQARAAAYVALACCDLGRYPEAGEWSALALGLSRELDFAEGVAMSLACRAMIASALGDQMQAIARAREARLAIPHLSDPRLEADCLTLLGRVEAGAGRFGPAVSSFDKALQVSARTGYRQGIARAEAECAAQHSRGGRYDDAAQSIRRAYRALRGGDLRLVHAQVLITEGDVLLAAGRWDAAVAGYRTAALRYREAADPVGEVRALLSWGRAAATVSGLGRPSRPLRRALGLAERLGLPEGAIIGDLLHR